MRVTLQSIHSHPEDEEDGQAEGSRLKGSDLHQMQRGACGWRSEGVAGKEGRLVKRGFKEGGGG